MQPQPAPAIPPGESQWHLQEAAGGGEGMAWLVLGAVLGASMRGTPETPPLLLSPGPLHTVYIPGPLIFLEHPMQIRCPACNQMIVTRISYQPGALAWLSCGGLALVG